MALRRLQFLLARIGPQTYIKSYVMDVDRCEGSEETAEQYLEVSQHHYSQNPESVGRRNTSKQK